MTFKRSSLGRKSDPADLRLLADFKSPSGDKMRWVRRGSEFPFETSCGCGQNQWYHFGVGASFILVYFSGDWHVHWGYGILTHGHVGILVVNKTSSDFFREVRNSQPLWPSQVEPWGGFLMSNFEHVLKNHVPFGELPPLPLPSPD